MNRVLIREQIRNAIIEDRLPRSGSKPRVFAGHGDKQVCACCHERIEPSAIQYDVDCQLGETVHTLSMHLACFEVWESESLALADVAGHSVCEDAA